MRKRFSNIVQCHAGRRNEREHDMTHGLSDNFHIVLEQQVIAAMDGAGQGILDGNNSETRFAAAYRIEDVFQGIPRQQFRGRREQVDGGVFAVCPARALVRGI